MIEDLSEEILWQREESCLSILNPPSATNLTVLLADDNAEDVFLTRMACEGTGVPHQLQIVRDGAMAVDYLLGKNCYADRAIHPMPDVVFLDINTPKQSGFEVLQLIRARPGLKQLPVIMLSTSTETADVDRAYQLGVTSFVRKVPSPAEFGRVIAVILKHWSKCSAQSKSRGIASIVGGLEKAEASSGELDPVRLN